MNGMSKKQIVQVVIIIGAFLGAAVVLYNGFFKNSNNAALLQSQSSQGSQQSPQEILPYGNTLNFSVLNQQNFYYDQVDYPQLDPSSDVGIPENGLITPSGTTGAPGS